MDVRRAYCSAVDRNVPVVLTMGAPTPGRPSAATPAALRCLDYPTRCTGWCCPLHAADEALTREADPDSRGGHDAGPREGAPDAASTRPSSQRKRWSRRT